jgi:5-methyltetrahydrofolate--homocysteine methyltransferase
MVMTTLRAALAERVVVANGAIGTMLQASDATVDDFAGHEGCNEILNVTRPDILAGIHEAYPEAGAECLTTPPPSGSIAQLTPVHSA